MQRRSPQPSCSWEGQPDAHHLAQLLLSEVRPVRGSVAAALT